MKVLIIGGYGVFGGRLARLLRDERRIRLIIAGRSLSKAQAFCLASLPGASCEAAVFDRDGDLDAQLRAIAPDIVVDASGPFQAYGPDGHRVVRAAIELGINYLDLADGADFVDEVSRFDMEARAAGVFVLSGVSSFPVLTAAVVRALSRDMDAITSIEGGIAPSPYAGVGENVIRAIAAYSGKAVKLRRAGRDTTGFAMAESRRYVIRPPGEVPLPSLRFSLVDVPDLRILPKLWPGLQDVWMGAGPVPEILHRALNGLALLVRWGVVPSLRPLSGLFHKAINILRWGDHRGGMYVSAEGLRGTSPVTQSWHMIAEGDDGPLIPSMAAEALIRRALAGHPPAPGARAATNELELADYERLFAGRAIVTGRREDRPGEAAETPGAQPLYRHVLGEAYDRLPATVRALHDAPVSVEGMATVERGSNPLGGLVADLFGFPKAGRVPVRVDFERTSDGGEIWRRTFDGRAFESRQCEGRGRWEGLIRESFGPVTVGLALLVRDGRLELVVRRWSVLGVVMPRRWGPLGPAYETDEDGVFAFTVTMAHPWLGVLVSYRGRLVAATGTRTL
ncbi:hypothetical protein KOAAANKH_01370 [Brevundimonas sp. NIBR10]|uniref:SDR family oxidoreductase n=1 Tax=Brevundimonas sp. NIBR10 TaxID=3015997 RepID=UPI0022F16234|nr:SDR family oxidoreductase [Brevundimonas sp. NIBR10]WGM46501.1 hypothetical protein KOAAANKH_01370 [Brevundimonas sp. NIBR10]